MNVYKSVLKEDSGGGSGNSFKIIVTCDPLLAGETITCTDGSDTYSRICPNTSPYIVTFNNLTVGEWIISSKAITKTVNINSQYSLSLILALDGKIVTPVNNITTWLACADIFNKNYTTIEEVLNDNDTLSTLISSNNASDYLVRSTDWINSICSHQTAMELIGLDNYCSHILLDSNDWLIPIHNSPYTEDILNVKIPVMTSDTTPSGNASASGVWKAGYEAYKAFNGNASQTQGWINDTHISGWLQYDFETPVYFYLFDYKGGVNGNRLALLDFKMQGTNNGVDMSDLTEVISNADKNLHNEIPFTKNNENAYRYIRIMCDTTRTVDAYNGIAVLQVYGRIDV